MERERIVAIGLLTRTDLSLLGPAFDRAWPIEEALADGRPEFSDLLERIDKAEEALRTDPDRP
jgi:hypothetical protein